MYRFQVLCWVACIALSGCGGCEDEMRDCSPVDISATQALPRLLSQTGLYENMSTQEIAPGVLPFTPRFPLWTDGARKHRWLLLPPGEKVDTSKEDDWRFPVGTRLFKDFVRDGVRVETRVVERTEQGWTGAAYIWKEDQSDAAIALDGGADVLGTLHDVPNAQECMACHGGKASFVLGFAAVQFDVSQRAAWFDSGILSHASTSEPNLTPVAKKALGHLHGNCSHCHNAQRNQQPHATSCYDPEMSIDFSLPVGLASVGQAPACKTASSELGNASSSTVVDRMSVRNQDAWTPSMPPLGTEVVDHEGIAALKAFLQEISN